MVNTFELLQAYVTFGFEAAGTGRQAATIGRQTLDLGSRRLVARNAFRNTPNAFFGGHWKWQREDTSVEAFYFLPMVRTPAAFDDLVANAIDLDDHNFDLQFFGAFAALATSTTQSIEMFALGLLERKGAKRELATVGARWLRPAARATIDWDLEGMVQVGASRLTTSDTHLVHVAGYLHGSVGYTVGTTQVLHVRAALDYASGDAESTDGTNNRFDTLFGARRFDYGPTGIYGPFARANLMSPEIRGDLTPVDPLRLMLAWRPAWLASGEDAWTSAGVRDGSGETETFIGHQLEVMAHYDVLPKNLGFELGGAYLFAGAFPREAPGGRGRDSLYGYAHLIGMF